MAATPIDRIILFLSTIRLCDIRFFIVTKKPTINFLLYYELVRPTSCFIFNTYIVFWFNLINLFHYVKSIITFSSRDYANGILVNPLFQTKPMKTIFICDNCFLELFKNKILDYKGKFIFIYFSVSMLIMGLIKFLE